MIGQVMGTAGGGLENATWAANADVARIGQAGEVRLAAILDRIAQVENGVTVLHDVRIPIPGFTANIDHVVVRGRMVYLIDAKVWRPAFYWTRNGKTRRGWERFKPAEKQTMAMAHKHVTSYLERAGADFEVAEPLVVVFPSSQTKKLSVRFLSVPGASAMHGDRFEKWAKRKFKPGHHAPAKNLIVWTLKPLLNGSS